MRRAGLLLLFSLAFAEEPRVVPPPETLADETLRTGDVLDVNLRAEQDVFLMGNEVTVDGDFAQDVWAGGRRVHFFGSARDDVRLFASEVLTVDGIVDGGSLRAFSGGNLLVNTNSVVRGRSRLTAARHLTLNGRFEGDMRLSAGRLIFAAELTGDLLLQSPDVIFMPGSRIDGDLYLPEGLDVTVPDRVLTGEIHRIPVEENAGGVFRRWVWYLRGFLIFNGFVLGMLMVRFLPRFSGNTVDVLLQFHPQSLVLGFFSALFLGLGGVALMMSQLGAGAALVFWGLLALLLISGQILVALALGAVLIRHKRPLTLLRLSMGLLVGLVLLQLLFALPLVGGTFWFLSSAWGLGAMIHTIRTSQRVLKLEIPDSSGDSTPA